MNNKMWKYFYMIFSVLNEYVLKKSLLKYKLSFILKQVFFRYVLIQSTTFAPDCPIYRT